LSDENLIDRLYQEVLSWPYCYSDLVETALHAIIDEYETSDIKLLCASEENVERKPIASDELEEFLRKFLCRAKLEPFYQEDVLLDPVAVDRELLSAPVPKEIETAVFESVEKVKWKYGNEVAQKIQSATIAKIIETIREEEKNGHKLAFASVKTETVRIVGVYTPYVETKDCDLFLEWGTSLLGLSVVTLWIPITRAVRVELSFNTEKRYSISKTLYYIPTLDAVFEAQGHIETEPEEQ